MKKTLFGFWAGLIFPCIALANVSASDDLMYRANCGELSAVLELADRYGQGDGVPADKSAALCYYLWALKNGAENPDELKKRIVSLGGTHYLPDTPEAGFSGEKYVADLGNGLKLELLKLPAGEFLMGSPPGEHGYFSDEKQVNVSLTEDFFLGETEVTQAQWNAVMGEKKKNPSHFQGENRPVECVTWGDAFWFCIELTARERAAGRLPNGMRFSLPTEAQWEYACRAGTRTRYFFGDSEEELPRYGNIGKNGDPVTMPVGSFLPNPWGFYDMHGNVSEWCLDSYDKKLPGGKNPCCVLRNNSCVHRGGSCDSSGDEFRSAARAGYPDDMKNRYLGFRVVLVKSSGMKAGFFKPSPVAGEYLFARLY